MYISDIRPPNPAKCLLNVFTWLGQGKARIFICDSLHNIGPNDTLNLFLSSVQSQSDKLECCTAHHL